MKSKALVVSVVFSHGSRTSGQRHLAATDFPYTVYSASPSVQLICVASTVSMHQRYPVGSQNNCAGSLICFRKCQAGFKTQILIMCSTSVAARTYLTYVHAAFGFLPLHAVAPYMEWIHTLHPLDNYCFFLL